MANRLEETLERDLNRARESLRKERLRVAELERAIMEIDGIVELDGEALELISATRNLDTFLKVRDELRRRHPPAQRT